MLNALQFGTSSTVNRRWDISNIIGALSCRESHPHDDNDELERLRSMYENVFFMDDVNGFKHLDKESFIKARQLEMHFFRKMGVYDKVPREQARLLGNDKVVRRQ